MIVCRSSHPLDMVPSLELLVGEAKHSHFSEKDQFLHSELEVAAVDSATTL